MLSTLDCLRAADECEHEAAATRLLAEVRQYRLLAQAWREMAADLERSASQEHRNCGSDRLVESHAEQ